MTEIRPRRSVLYMPGANERALEKAKGIDADALILDLEDAVAPDAKAAGPRARRAPRSRPASTATASSPIRVNGIGTEWHDDDLAAAAAGRPRRRPRAQGRTPPSEVRAPRRRAGGRRRPRATPSCGP